MRYWSTFDRIKEKSFLSHSPQERTPKFNKKFKKFLNKKIKGNLIRFTEQGLKTLVQIYERLNYE